MTFQLTSTGLEIDTFDTALTEVAQGVGTALSLTAEQTERIRQNATSALGNLCRIITEQRVALQETVLDVFESISLNASGSNLDNGAARLLGVTRRSALASRVTLLATGTPASSIANGVRVRYNPESTVWTVVDGPYTIGGGGTVSITVEAGSNDAYEVAVDPATGYDDWTILDSSPGLSTVESTAQPIVGTPAETDAALRVRLAVEAYRRGQGPIRTIEASISAVTGVTFARVFENRTLVTDSDGIPGKAFNAVVEGGDNTQIAQAIFDSRPAGAEIYSASGGTQVQVTLTDDYGFSHLVGFNRVTAVDIYFRVTLTTSTSETTTPAGISATVQSLVVTQSALLFGPGDDILPWALEGVIYAQNYGGIDSAVVEVSDDGVSWSTSKYSIEIREKGAFAIARTTMVIA